MLDFNEQVVAAFKFLQINGIGNDEIKAIHHNPGGIGGYKKHIDYWTDTKDFRSDNFEFGMKVVRMANKLQLQLSRSKK